MERPGIQISVATMLGLVACVAFNIWLFRCGAIWGLIGLNLSKHVLVASLCQVLGVDRRVDREAGAPAPIPPSPYPPARFADLPAAGDPPPEAPAFPIH